jgi:hypothetical protein
LRRSRSRLLYGLQRVPDDRLNWSPGEQARSPLALADYFAGFLQVIAAVTREREWPDRSGLPPPPPSATREEARARLDAGFRALEEAVAAVPAAELDAPTPAPWGAPIAVREWLMWGTAVMGYCQGQMNYCQLAYGDADPNIPPGWGSE